MLQTTKFPFVCLFVSFFFSSGTEKNSRSPTASQLPVGRSNHCLQRALKAPPKTMFKLLKATITKLIESSSL